MKPIRFNDALRRAAEATQFPDAGQIGIIRDVYGRIRFAINKEAEGFPATVLEHLRQTSQSLGGYGLTEGVVFRDHFSDPDAIFNHPDWHQTIVPGYEYEEENGEIVVAEDIAVRVLDRQITGQDWLHTPSNSNVEPRAAMPPRLVFYGIKGGVGRSTSLAMLAYLLAQEGKRVLLLDFDLESPGLSGLLLPPERRAEFGLVDWFVEDAVGQSDTLTASLVTDSPLAENLSGSIRVASAIGNGETAYLAKLARVYADVPAKSGAVRFADRMRRLVEALEAQEQPDVVLIDSRAGLHDLAAISIAGLATLALLFATDTPQNWQGYQQLFAHWQCRPEVLRGVRERLAIVQALFPESDQEGRARRFLENSWNLFRESLYDNVEAGCETPADAFTFDLESEGAPHFPLRVRWNARFQEFDPLLSESKGGVGQMDVELAFGSFFRSIKAMVFEE
jgi:cellulose biosynthesis protein BcsQ